MKTLLLLCVLALVACEKSTPLAAPVDAGRREIPVAVDAKGYHPPTLTAPPNAPVRVLFTRTSEHGCGDEVVFPTLSIRRALPLNQAVAVDLTMPASGSVGFTCGMNMYRGAIVAQ